MTQKSSDSDVGNFIIELDPEETGWVSSGTLQRAFLDRGYPPSQCKEIFDYADMTTDDGMIPILPFFVRLKRSGLLKIRPSLRFAIGARVLVTTGRGKCAAGTVVRLNAREPNWPRDYRVPYEVELEDGGLIYIEEDTPGYVCELVPPWWHRFKQGLQCPSAAELLEASSGQDLNRQCHKGIALLHFAVSKTWLEVVEELIKLQADVDIIDQTHSTPLHKAASVKSAEAMTRALCIAGADVNCQDLNPDYDPDLTSTIAIDHDFELHRTPLHYSSEIGDVSTMRILLDFRADVNIQDGELNAPLHLAIQEEMCDAIDLLLKAGANANLPNLESGLSSPLMYAAYHNNHALAERLIEARADINQKGKSGMTAMHLAARSGNVPIARMLLSARADIAQESACGTASDLAIKNGKQDLLHLLGVDKAKYAQQLSHSQGYVTSATQLDASQRSALFID
eukprot:TRINITY_DN110814_c0_g1_i1.p1 TRINITY_DN110814_c0_g1~~TRINITY_DN110814_c0_g1_i1.p1  ORF type:complete len:476 (+),score=44.55 TRINITY_DN110814_c0_g1_i1:67-1428(+)